MSESAETVACPCCGETNYDDPADCTFCEDQQHGEHRSCRYCGTVLHIEQDVWVDATGGDVCSGDDDLVNENELHAPSQFDGGHDAET